MNWQDLTTVLKGALKKGLETMADLLAYCKTNNLNNNAQMIQHFSK